MFFAVLGVNVRVAVGGVEPAFAGGMDARNGAGVALGFAAGPGATLGGAADSVRGKSPDTAADRRALADSVGGVLPETLGVGNPLAGGGGLRILGVLGVRGVVLTESGFGIFGAGNALDFDCSPPDGGAATGGLSSDRLAVISIGAAFSLGGGGGGGADVDEEPPGASTGSPTGGKTAVASVAETTVATFATSVASFEEPASFKSAKEASLASGSFFSFGLLMSFTKG